MADVQALGVIVSEALSKIKLETCFLDILILYTYFFIIKINKYQGDQPYVSDAKASLIIITRYCRQDQRIPKAFELILEKKTPIG